MRTTIVSTNSIHRLLGRFALFLIPLLFSCFGILPGAQAVSPAPDGGYAGDNTAEGDSALFSLTSGIDNTALGFRALYHNNGNYNTAEGYKALYSNTSGTQNTANGVNALLSNTTGAYNTADGVNSLYHNTIGNGNTANGASALFSNTTGNGNTAIGQNALQSNTTGASNNTANGVNALAHNTTGNQNTANGSAALASNTTGHQNTANGSLALFSNTTGKFNTADGYDALHGNTTGSKNTALGYQAGSDTGGGGNNNIDIGYNVVGAPFESNTIRIGNTDITDTYIRGISGQTAAGGAAVFVNSNGKLGTSTSSARFKDEIKPMGNASEAILALRPVSFRYKKEIDPQGIPEFGLVAEEVEKVNPDLVIRDPEGRPYTVRYEQVNAMLLNEFLNEHKKVEDQGRELQKQAATIAKQQKQIEALTAGLQKLSHQLDASKPALQVVYNNQ